MAAWKKKLIKPIALCSCLILFLIIASQFIAVSIDGLLTNAGGGCIAIAFDKAAVMGADKIVAYVDDDVITITDEALVREVSSNFVVANRTDLCDERNGNRLEIYNGDRLVRTVYWSGCVDTLAEIYQEDELHWIPGVGTLGQVELSREVYQRIIQIIEDHRAEGA